MRTDLIDWRIEQGADGSWVAAAPGVGVSLEGEAGLMELMAAAGLVDAEGPPAGRQEAFSLAMDRAIHQVRIPGPGATKAALHEAIERCAELKVIINTPGTAVARVRQVVGATVAAARALDGAVKDALAAVPINAGLEFRNALTTALVHAAATGREISAYAGTVAERAKESDGFETAIIGPWRDVAAKGDDVVVRAMKVEKAIDGIGYQYEERWLVARLDGVYVYVVGRQGRIHVFVSKQRLKQNADRPARVA